MLFEHTRCVRLLLEYGVNRQGKTDLFIAAAMGKTEEVGQMLDNDSSEINVADMEWNATALDVAGRSTTE